MMTGTVRITAPAITTVVGTSIVLFASKAMTFDSCGSSTFRAAVSRIG